MDYLLRAKAAGMNRWLERGLNLSPGDFRRGVPLASALFLTITAYVIGQVSRDALFLNQFPAVALPYADISSGIAVGFVVALYLRIGRRTPLGKLMVRSPLFFAACSALFWILTHYIRPSSVYPVFYVWVGIMGVLAPTQVWTLANYVLTTREAKRVYGMVAAGGILGAIFGGYLCKVIAREFGTESLLLAMTVLLFACSASMNFALRAGKVTLDASLKAAEGGKGAGQRDLRESIRSILSSSYLRAIAALIWISSFSTTLTNWQFKALAKHFFASKNAMAMFFGDFYFYAGIIALLFQLLLSTRLLRRFGVGPMLFLLPLLVLAGSGGLLVFGTIAAAVFLKGGNYVLRFSIDRSTTELLYLPLSNQVKLQAKWFIDTVIWRLGDGLAGITVLIFATHLHWTAQQVSWIAIVLILGWMCAVYVAGKQYVVVLQDSISRHRLNAEQATALALDRSTAELLAQRILSSDPKEILYALSLFEVERERAAHPVIRGLLNHPSAEVRQKAISILSSTGDKSVNKDMEALVRDPDPNVRTEAMLFLVHHAHVDPIVLLSEVGDCADYSVRSAIAAYLARPGEAQNIETARAILLGMCGESGDEGQRTRLELARLLGELPDLFDPLLGTLLHDPAPAVVRQAISSVGALRKVALASDLVELLHDRNLCAPAADALGKFGDEVISLLGTKFSDSATPVDTRRAIPAILVEVGTPAAARLIFDNLLERDTALRFQMISALNKIHQMHPEIALDMHLMDFV